MKIREGFLAIFLPGCVAGNLSGDMYPDALSLFYDENRGQGDFEHSSWGTNVSSDLDAYGYGLSLTWGLTDATAKYNNMREHLPPLPVDLVQPEKEHPSEGDFGVDDLVNPATGGALGVGGAATWATLYFMSRRRRNGNGGGS